MSDKKIEVPADWYEHAESHPFYTTSMLIFGQSLDIILRNHIYGVLALHRRGHPVPEVLDCWTDNFGEIIEKLMILHIRAWHLENEIFDGYNDDKKLAETKKKLDVLWKRKRPALVAAVNRMADEAIVHGRSLVEDSVKLYKGYEKEN